MPTRMPMMFSNTRQTQIQTQIQTQTQTTSTNTITPQQLRSRFTMHDLNKVAKKGCKSCGS